VQASSGYQSSHDQQQRQRITSTSSSISRAYSHDDSSRREQHAVAVPVADRAKTAVEAEMQLRRSAPERTSRRSVAQTTDSRPQGGIAKNKPPRRRGAPTPLSSPYGTGGHQD